ncbi:ABC transporter permease [Mycoplasmopsis columbina]|uniref:ABC transporter permease n=1 Tax=Mycoplasmopsis columbina TaxID=114881 RepID=UPI0004A74626|nr:ABC transporter permease [Mycoplasmopsis columbina]VEU76973.1 Glutathione transport system permease protein gsiD [Mycoplasmopsis columbina]
MALNVNEFNQKYKLNQDLALKVKLAQSDAQKSSSIAGKPKKLGVEIVKRFFTNPAVIISVIVFFTIIIMSLIIPATSSFSPNKEVSSLAYTSDLPPYNAPIAERIADPNGDFTATYNKITNFLQNYEHKDLVNNIKSFNLHRELLGNQYHYTYNAYDFFRLNHLITLLNQKEEAGVAITQSLVNELWASTDLNTLLGTTSVKYDVWTRTWYATWRAIKISLIIAIIQAIIGISLGALLGFKAGSLLDTIVMRLIDIFESAPTLIWILIFVSVFGTSEITLIVVLSLVGWPGFVGTARVYVITVKNEEFINASKAVGASTTRQVFVHALPAVIGKLAYSFVRSIPGIILWISSLAFFGFFRETNDVNLGQLLISANAEYGANIWIILLPALILLSISLSLSFIALGLHDALDPRVMAKKKRR